MTDEVKKDVFYTIDEQDHHEEVDVMFNSDGSIIIKDFEDDSILISEVAVRNLQRLLNQKYPPNKYCPACGLETKLKY